MVSDRLDLNGDFVKNRDSIFEYYFNRDISSMDELIAVAGDAFADVVNYHLRMKYSFGETQANEQVWFMSEWLLNNKDYSILPRDKYNPEDNIRQLANILGTAIFRWIEYKNCSSTTRQSLWNKFRKILKENKTDIAITIIKIILAITGLPVSALPDDIKNHFKH